MVVTFRAAPNGCEPADTSGVVRCGFTTPDDYEIDFPANASNVEVTMAGGAGGNSEAAGMTSVVNLGGLGAEVSAGLGASVAGQTVDLTVAGAGQDALGGNAGGFGGGGSGGQAGAFYASGGGGATSLASLAVAAGGGGAGRVFNNQGIAEPTFVGGAGGNAGEAGDLGLQFGVAATAGQGGLPGTGSPGAGGAGGTWNRSVCNGGVDGLAGGDGSAGEGGDAGIYTVRNFGGPGGGGGAGVMGGGAGGKGGHCVAATSVSMGGGGGAGGSSFIDPSASAPSIVDGAAAPNHHNGWAVITYQLATSTPTNLVKNGGFEKPNAAGQILTIFDGGRAGPWRVISGSVDVVGSWPAAKGQQSLDVAGEAPGTIRQTLAVPADGSYKVGFSMAGNPECGPAVKKLRVLWDGAAVLNRTFDTTGRTIADLGWVKRSVTVDTTAGSHTLAFASTSIGPCGPTLDAVSVKEISTP